MAIRSPQDVPPRRSAWLVGFLVILLTGCVAAMALTAAQPGSRMVFVLAALSAGGLIVTIWRQGGVPMSVVLLLAAIFRISFLWLPPTLSDDAYRYVWDGLIQQEGYNPYLYVPADSALAAYHDEPVFDRLNSKEYYSVYPPISQLIYRLGAFFYEGGWLVSYYVIKAIFAMLEMAAVLILSRMVRPGVLILYAWNPLVLISGAGQAHGEAALVLCLVLTMYAARRGRGGWAGVWLGCASWVKLYPVLLFPLLLRRFGWRSALGGALCMTLLGLPYAHPDVLPNIMKSLDLYVRLFEFNAGFYYLVKEVLEILTGADWSKQIGPAFRLLFLASLPGIYILDRRRGWPLPRAFAVVIGAFLIFSTTVHPWYLIGILAVASLSWQGGWHWFWVGLASIGTYLLYVGGPYWIWVVIGWTGWLILGMARYGRRLLDELMRFRARGKAALLAPFLSRGDTILDVGAAEGFVAEHLTLRCGVQAKLVDIADMNRTQLPHQVYDGGRLPFANDSVDVIILVYVLHHAVDPRWLLREARRVASRRIIVLESTYERRWEEPLLRQLDHTLNFIRSLGRMDRESLHFRTFAGWLKVFDELEIPVKARRHLRGFIHHRSLYILDAVGVGRPIP